MSLCVERSGPDREMQLQDSNSLQTNSPHNRGGLELFPLPLNYTVHLHLRTVEQLLNVVASAVKTARVPCRARAIIDMSRTMSVGHLLKWGPDRRGAALPVQRILTRLQCLGLGARLVGATVGLGSGGAVG